MIEIIIWLFYSTFIFLSILQEGPSFVIIFLIAGLFYLSKSIVSYMEKRRV